MTDFAVRISKEEAIRRLRAAGHEAAGKALEDWRDQNNKDMGWDGWVRGEYPDLVNVIWN